MAKALLLLLILLSFPVQLSFADDCHVIFGMRSDNQPFSWIDSKGRPQGFTIELLDAMTKEAQCTYEVAELSSWSAAVDSLENGDIDMIYLSPTNHLDSFAIYIPLSFVMSRYIFTRTGEPIITTKEELRGKTVVVAEGGFSDEILTDIQDEYNITISRHHSSEDAVYEFSNGVGDALVSTLTIVTNLADEYSNKNIVSGGIPMISPASVFALRRSNFTEYARLVNALETLKSNGEYFEIMKKWSALPQRTSWFRLLLLAALTMGAISFVVFIWIKSLRIQVAKRTALLNKEIEIHKDTREQLLKNIAENVKLRDEAIMAGRLAVLGEMSANIAHEINNPTGLMVHNTGFLRDFYSEMLKIVKEHMDDYELICGMPLKTLEQELNATLLSMDKCLLRIKTTVDELKSFTNRSPNAFETVDVISCVESAIRFSSYFIRKYTKNFSLNIIEPLMPFLGNALEIEQMVVNLIHNSCQALTRRSDKITCTIQASEDGKYMVISVQDEGCGMSEDVMQKAHQAFFTTRRDMGGTGLGLSIIDRIMGEHKGHYTIESTLGEGTTVGLWFPV